MSFIARIERALVLAPHPDDEVLGCGGTIARLAAEGKDVRVAIATRGQPPLFAAEQADRVRAEALRAHELLGVSETRFLDFPAAQLDTLANAELTAGIAGLVEAIQPDTLFLPFAGDLHVDHKLIFAAGMVAARPRGERYPVRVLAYEVLSETNWSAPFFGPAFEPNLFVDISGYADAKLRAFACFASQCRPFPDERSIETLEALARLRGSTVHRGAGEAFIMIREVS
jgi:N-acetylglucosamine malate deacetylase 1